MRPPPRLRAALLAAVLGWSCESPYAARPGDEVPATSPVPAGENPAAAAANAEPVHADSTEAVLGEGFVVWESSRSQMWRLWIRDLADPRSPARQLTPDEPGRQHCCAHPAPDGESLAYLSLPHGQQRYPEAGAAGVLRLLEPNTGEERVIAEAARTYSEHRAVVWRSTRELIHIDGDGRTVLLDVESGTTHRLTEKPLPAHGYLIDPQLHHATTGVPTFSDYDAERREVRERPYLGGCQPYFSADGRWGYWIAGAGGPVNAMELASRRVKTLLRKSDPRLPADQGYVYFPMYSPDGRYFTFAASRDEHSHHQADYDVFVARSDPRTLEIVGPVVRMSEHPATDRFPAVWSAPPPPGEKAVTATVPSPPEPSPEERREGWPATRQELLFLWDRNGGDVEVVDPATGLVRSSILRPRGRAFYGRHGEMVLDGGAFEVGAENMQAVFEGARATNEITLEALVVPAAPVPENLSAPAWILTFSSGDRARNFSLGQRGTKLIFRLRTSNTGPNADAPQVELGELPVGTRSHLVVSYTPGRLRAFLDGAKIHETKLIKSGFHHWRPRALLFGNEAGGVDRPWRGRISGVAIYGRALDDAEAAANHQERQERLDELPPVATVRLRGRLTARSPIPSLDEISPYTEALAVFEYEVVEVLSGDGDFAKIRVAQRVWIDGERQEVATRRLQDVYEFWAEPFADHPELDPLYVSDDLSTTGSDTASGAASSVTAPLFYEIPFP